MGACERTVTGRGGSERPEVDEIGWRELWREAHTRAREGRRPLDMGEEGRGSEGRGGRAQCIWRDEGGGSNDGKMSAEYVRGLRESGSVEQVEVMLVVFRMRKGFRQMLVMGLKERGYDGKKAAGGAYHGGRPEGEMSRPEGVGKRAAPNASGRIGCGPFTSGQKEPGRALTEQEFTL